MTVNERWARSALLKIAAAALLGFPFLLIEMVELRWFVVGWISMVVFSGITDLWVVLRRKAGERT